MVGHGVLKTHMDETSSLALNQGQTINSVKMPQICHLTMHCQFHSCHFINLLVSEQIYLAVVIRTDHYFNSPSLSSLSHSPKLRPPIA